MDEDYRKNILGPDDVIFEQALTVLATVISTSIPGQIVLDAGLKALSVDSGLPSVPIAGARTSMSDEHSVALVAPGTSIRVGDRIAITPSHVDPTVNLHDWFIGVRTGREWKLYGRSVRVVPGFDVDLYSARLGRRHAARPFVVH